MTFFHRKIHLMSPYAPISPLHPYTPTSILSMPYPKRDFNLIFRKYKEADPYLVCKAQYIMNVQAFHDHPNLITMVNNKIKFNRSLDATLSNVLKMATIDAYSAKKVYNPFSHSEIPLISSTDLRDVLDKVELRPSGYISSNLSIVQ
mmetsp:Transcript_15873/g.22610  ORF Transcript_15873/g.22610 Transcript_15873/m.22610 type:complete len:147 (+) Transcript_15873:1075-1515(+)